MGMSTHTTSPFNETFSWDFNNYDEFVVEDINSDNEILTALVRTSYLSHLQRSLTNNYDLWFQKNEGNDDFNEIGQNDIMKCANFLEYRALRACMVTSYYRRAMIKTMKEIKQSTEEGSLFSPLIEQLFDNKCATAKNMCDKGTQTVDFAPPVAVEVKLPQKVNQEVQVPKVVKTLPNSNLIVINPHTDLISDQERTDDIEDLFNILMNSPSFSEAEKIKNHKKRKYPESVIDIQAKQKCKSNDPLQGNLEYINPIPITHKKICSKRASCDSSLAPKENDLLSSKCDSNLTEIEPKKSNLDERLQALAALFGEDSPKDSHDETVNSSNTDIEVPLDNSSETNSLTKEPLLLPLDWKAEFGAQNCHLKKILSRMSSARRYYIHKRFKELFGSERKLHTYISINEEALSRKRTANLVVGELTPHYIGGKIASRIVFKALAKKITDELLHLPYVAETEEISAKVNTYFENGNCINSVKEVADLI